MDLNENDTYEMLRRIEQKIDEILKVSKSQPVGATSGDRKTVADAELDQKYGDPSVRYMPSRWSGQNYVGMPYSGCDPEFLDELAAMLDNVAKKQAADPEKAKFADWSAKDAARARAWAIRHRTNGPPKGKLTGSSDPDAWTGSDEEMPF